MPKSKSRKKKPPRGPVFRAIIKAGRVWGEGMSAKVLCDVVRAAAARAASTGCLVCKQNLRVAVNDRLGIEPDAA